MPRSFERLILGKLFRVSLLGFIWITQAWAQGGATAPSAIWGSYSSGAVVASAEIRIVNQDTGTLICTPRLIPVRVHRDFTPGWQRHRECDQPRFSGRQFINVAARVTETTRMEAKLRPLAVQEKVDVQAQVQTVDTSTATTGAGHRRAHHPRPAAGHENFQQLLTLSGGTNSDLNASASLGRGDVRIQVNGQREDNNNYLIEGISAMDYNVAELTNTPLPSPDVVQEFKVQTSLYAGYTARSFSSTATARCWPASALIIIGRYQPEDSIVVVF